MSKILTVKQVAERLNVNDRTVCRLAEEGKLPGLRYAGAWRFPADDVYGWIEAQQLEAAHPQSCRDDGGCRIAVRPAESRQSGDRVGAIVNVLHFAYGEADLGNLPDAVDELVYISLTRQTHSQNAGESWERVLDVGGPAALVDMPEDDLVELLQRGGFAHQKARWIKRSLEIVRDRMGSLSLDGVADWPDNEVEDFLRSLPGIGIKSAKCIMLYSLGRYVLPVDTHVRRISTRVGLVEGGLSELRIHRELEWRVPPEDRLGFHVNCIWHGRQVCTALRPRCASCAIRQHCDLGRTACLSPPLG